MHGVYTVDNIERCTLNTIVHSYVITHITYKAGAYTKQYIVTLESPIHKIIMHRVILMKIIFTKVQESEILFCIKLITLFSL